MKYASKYTLILTLIIVCSWLKSPPIARTNEVIIRPNKNNKCPTNIPELANLMTEEISDYANRVIQKSRPNVTQENFLPLYIITASQPDFKPIKIEQRQYQNQKDSQIKQIFFTTLERQYSNEKKIIQVQNYHWLLLTPTSQGWQMVMLLTNFGISNDNSIYSPPQDTSNSIMGQAVKLWLKDCQFSE